MTKRFSDRFDEPAVDGPDYVALVIEWADGGVVAEAISDSLEEQVTRPTARPRTRWRKITDTLQPIYTKVADAPVAAKAAGAVGVLALAGWGLRRLRAA